MWFTRLFQSPPPLLLYERRLSPEEKARSPELQELARAQEERLEKYKYIGSDEHLKELNEWLTSQAHENITPPWEDND